MRPLPCRWLHCCMMSAKPRQPSHWKRARLGPGHEGVSEQISHVILDALGADEQLKKEVLFLVRHHMTAHNKDANARTLRRLVLEGGRELVDQLLQHGVAMFRAAAGILPIARGCAIYLIISEKLKKVLRCFNRRGSDCLDRT